MSIAVMSEWELDLSTFALVAARIRRDARWVNHVNGSGFSDRRGRDGGTPQSLRCARAVLPAVSLLRRFLSLLAGIDNWISRYNDIFSFIGWFFGFDLKFLPESREDREVRETRPGPPRLASRRRAGPRANGRRRGGRGGLRGSPAPPSSSARRRRGSGCGSGSPGAG